VSNDESDWVEAAVETARPRSSPKQEGVGWFIKICKLWIEW